MTPQAELPQHDAAPGRAGRIAARVAGAGVAIAGAVSLFGHALVATSGAPVVATRTTDAGSWFDVTVLPPLAAAAFVLFGAGLLLSARTRPPHRLLRGAGLAAKAAAIVAILVQILPLLSSPPGGATGSGITLAVAFGCLAVTIVFQNGTAGRLAAWTALPLLPVFWASYLSVTAGFFRVEHLNSYFALTLIPLPAAVLFGFLMIGFLALQPRRGLMGVFNSRYSGGMVARVAFPILFIVPFTNGWIRVRTLRSGDFDLGAAFSQFVTTNILVFGAFIWFCAHVLNRMDARRQQTLESLQAANTELQRVNATLETTIAERAEHEVARKKTELQLFQSQKMEAMGTLASGIAHDFNNLLTVMLLNTEAAREASTDRPEIRKLLEEIRSSGLQATEIVGRIMAFGRRDPGERKPLDPAAVVADAVRMMQHALPRSVDIRTGTDAPPPRILGDSTQIQQVLLNLGTNAAHAMGDAGGVLEIRVRTASVPAARAALTPDLHAGRYVIVSVRDDGHGMDEETRTRVFDPFFTTKPPGKGTGLGLSVAHGIMKLHEGAITVYSEPGRGTSFELYFPVPDTDEPGEAPRAIPSEAPRGGGELILCVDDDPPLVNAVCRRLERAGYATVRHTDPRAALEDFGARPEAFRLVLTDYSMPGISGRELTEAVLRLRPGMPVILMSGFLVPEEEEAVRRSGVSRVLLKPDVLADLDRAVHELLRDEPQA